MCETCGCGNKEGFTINDPRQTQDSDTRNGHDHDHGRSRTHELDHTHEHSHDHNHAHTHDHGHHDDIARRRVVDLNIDILEGNRITAAMNRRFLEGRRVLCLNMVSSPGSGKTTILEKTITHFMQSHKLYVIEGDQQTMIDAERIEKAGARAVQVNTGSGCHLDAHMVEHALERLDPEAGSVLFIENVGNLVCPALFDLGEAARVLVMSVTEGEDKPLKYPMMFETSHLCIINKSDLLPHIDFRVEKFMNNARLINHRLEFITVSAKTGEGMDAWYDWISVRAGETIR